MPKLSQLSKQPAQLSFNTITYLSNDQIGANLIDISLVQGDLPWQGFRADARISRGHRFTRIIEPTTGL